MQMWEAASRGDVEKVEKLAHMGVDINVANEVTKYSSTQIISSFDFLCMVHTIAQIRQSLRLL